MTALLRPTEFTPLRLTLQDVGPLRGLTDISFTNPSGEPTNLYLVMGPNGGGKTTLLDSIFTAYSLLDASEHASFGIDALDKGQGGLQLDAVVALDDGIRSRLYLLSIVAGEPGLLRRWSLTELEELNLDQQIVLRYTRLSTIGGITRSNGSDPEAIGFAEAIIERAGDPSRSLFEVANGYPTVLYFPSDRGIRRPPERERAITRPEGLGYRAAHYLGVDGTTWASSIDNLFVWFTWLDDGREKLCRDLVNQLVFRRGKRLASVDRQTLLVPVEVDGETHRLDQLSSGERQFVQIVVRIASHMTGSTLVLIDETEQHLHLVLRRRLINMIKTWAAEYRGIRFIMTSHQAESMRMLAPKQEEPGLVKGGCLVKPRFPAPDV